MYLTNFRVSALALPFSLMLIFGAARYAPGSADARVDRVDSDPVSTLEAAPASDDPKDPAAHEGRVMW